MQRPLKQRIANAVEDLVMNAPTLMDFGLYENKNYLKSGRLIGTRGGILGGVDYAVTLKEIKDFLFGQDYVLAPEGRLEHVPFAPWFRRKIMHPKSLVDLLGLGLQTFDEPTLLEIIRVVVFFDPSLQAASSFVNKGTEDKTFYHGSTLPRNSHSIETLVRKGNLLSYSYSYVSFSPDPAYALKFGDVLLEFSLKSFQREKLPELIEFQKNASKFELNDGDWLCSLRGNIYLLRDKQPVLIQKNGIQEEFQEFYVNRIIGEEFEEGDKLAAETMLHPHRMFSGGIRPFREFTNGYSRDEFLKLNLDKMAEPESRKLLFFRGQPVGEEVTAGGGDHMEIRMSFHPTVISGAALKAVYTTPQRRKYLESIGAVVKGEDGLHFKTQNTEVPLHITRNIPRKVNEVNRMRYEREKKGYAV